MDKLNINLFEGVTEEKYREKRAEYIAKATTYNPGGFLSMGWDKPDPAKGEAEWNAIYPEGYKSWSSQQFSLNANGEQSVIDKINEIVHWINKQNNH